MDVCTDSGKYATASDGAWSVPYYELYGGPVTLSPIEWRQYIISGKHILYGSGGIIPGGTYNHPYGGTIYKGHVHQGL